MADTVVKVRGLNELNRAFRTLSPDLRRELRDELAEAGRIVADDARERFEGYSPRAAMGIRHRIKRQTEVVVEQRHRTTTGQRPDFGRLQMRKALLPARQAKRPELIARLDRMLSRLASEHGF